MKIGDGDLIIKTAEAYNEEWQAQYDRGYTEGKNSAFSEVGDLDVKIKEVIFINEKTNEEIKVVPCNECIFLVEPYNYVKCGNVTIGEPMGGKAQPVNQQEDISYIMYKREIGKE